MQPVPPAVREGWDEITRALSCKWPGLVTDAHIMGILQAHTDRSDGVNTLEMTAEAMLAADPSILASRIIRSPRIMRAVSARKKSPSSRRSAEQRYGSEFTSLEGSSRIS
jgi:hypothetical protein